MKTIIRSILLLTAVGFTPVVYSQDISGIWKVSIEAKQPMLPSPQVKHVIVSQDGANLTTMDFDNTKETNSGKVVDNQMKFVLSLGANSKDPVQLTGTVQKGEIAGTTTLDGVSVHWRAFKLASVWACSHKDPVHTASTESSMRELSQKNGCKGWKKLEEGKESALITLLKDRAQGGEKGS